MLIHGRLIVTHNGLMLDEVRSLLQKSLRRQELDLAYRATKELVGHEKDQLPWKSLVTFMFEDHCLTDVTTLGTFYDIIIRKNKYQAVELLGKCFTCRYAACLQVVALGEEYQPNAELWIDTISLDPEFVGLVAKTNGGIDCDILIALIIKYWKEKNTKALTTMFALVNMAAKVENRTITGKGSKFLPDNSMKKPNLYHLVLSLLYKTAPDEYMKKYAKLCYHFAAMTDTPQGLILFCTLSQMMFKDKVMSHVKPDVSTVGAVQWATIPKLEHMPSWAVDKHTFRGKFGKESLHIFKKKFRNSPLSELEQHEFHGPRPKADIRMFFEVGCVCNNDILDENPIFEQTKQMYYKQKPSLQKTAKMTKALYHELKREKAVCFGKPTNIKDNGETEKKNLKRTMSSTSVEPSCSGEPKLKQLKLSVFTVSKGDSQTDDHQTVDKSEDTTETAVKDNEQGGDRTEFITEKTTKDAETPDDRTEDITAKTPEEEKKVAGNGRSQQTTVPPLQGPLLQLPTGSAKVYTRLDTTTLKVWKGPYKTVSKQNLCTFFHRAMKEVFHDSHTMNLDVSGPFIIFPLLKSDEAQIVEIHKEYYDCIGKKQVSAEEGVFITRESLGLVQLHKISQEKIRHLPASIWAHFAFRYMLNIGDSGLYNAIAKCDLSEIYGIDMEENRAQVKATDIVNLMFTKLPKKAFIGEIQAVLKVKKANLQAIFEKNFDFQKLTRLYAEYNVEDETDRCQRRLKRFKSRVDALN